MSYHMALHDPVTDTILKVSEPHFIRGGTYAVGGTTLLELNITCNYAPHFRRVLGEKGIRTIYGMTGAESLPVLAEAVRQLGNDVDDDDYWNPTEGNAKRALMDLMVLAVKGLDGIWKGD